MNVDCTNKGTTKDGNVRVTHCCKFTLFLMEILKHIFVIFVTSGILYWNFSMEKVI